MTGDDATPAHRPAKRPRADPAATRVGSWQRWQGADEASRAMANILAGPAVWGGIGWLADRWLGTDPWLMSVGVMGGFAGGLYLVWLRMKAQDERSTRAGTTQDDDQAEGERNVPPTRRQRPEGTGRPAP